MQLLDKLISVVAPHDCISCGQEGAALCESCRLEFISAPPSRCFHCLALTRSNACCKTAKKKLRVSHVWVASEYGGVAKSLVRLLKYGGAREAAGVMAKAIAEALPYLPKNTLVIPIPTITSHQRIRHFDHTKLIAKEVAKLQGLIYDPLLLRMGQLTQVGSAKTVRTSQLQGSMYLPKPVLAAEANVLLIDDMVTTGSTLQEAARALRDAGAKSVDAAVFAQKVL